MRLSESLVLYGLLGLGCGYYQARLRSESPSTRALLVGLSVLFWPLLLPMLISREQGHDEGTRPEPPPQPGPYHRRIQEGISQVEAAIAEADGTTGRLLRREIDMLDAITRQLYQLDGELHKIQHIRAAPAFCEEAIDAELERAEAAGASPVALESLAIKKQNARQMATIEAEHTQRLEDSLALLGRIHSQITLLRFTGQESPQLADSADQLLTLLDSLQEAASLSSTRSIPAEGV